MTSARRQKRTITESWVWERFIKIQKQHTESRWQQTINQMRVLDNVIRSSGLPHYLSALCQLEITQIQANHGGFGHKLSAIQMARTIRNSFDCHSEPELVRKLFSVEGVALHVIGLYHEAVESLCSGLELVKAERLSKSLTIGTRIQLAQSLSAVSRHAEAIIVLGGVLDDALDKNMERDIQLAHLRLSDILFSAKKPDLALRHLETSMTLLDNPNYNRSAKEINRIKVIQDRILIRNYLIYERDTYKAAQILQGALSVATRYRYSFQQSKLLRLKKIIETQ